eukprot:344649_1
MNITEVLPMNSPGSDRNDQGQVVAVVTLTTEEESSSGVSATLYFFLAWIALLLLVAAVCALAYRHRTTNHKQQQQRSDVEAASSIQYTSESKGRKINPCITFTIMFTGHFIGLALSIFSVAT